MNTKTAWEQYHSQGTIESDAMLIAMLHDIANTIGLLETIYGSHTAQLTVRAMLPDYQILNNMAWHRGLKGIPHL